MNTKTKAMISALALLPAAYLFAIAPGRQKKALMKRLKDYDYAHRGLHDNLWGVPENSMTAFASAIENNYGIELDIHLTRDHRLVVFHDDNLRRMCRTDREICEMTWDELSKLRLLNTDETIPLFEDVLKLVDGKVPLIIELKVDHDNYNALCTLADRMLSAYHGDYCIESFHPLAVFWYRKNRKNIVRGQLACNFKKYPRHFSAGPLALSHLITNVIARPDFIAYNYEDRKNLGFFLNHRLFHAMTVMWTVTNAEDIKVLKKQGHTIIFEQPH